MSLQVVVTSRPAAFANSPGMPDDTFPCIQLIAITRPIIDAYVERWIAARHVPDRDAAEMRRILREKLDQPHLRDLARNPMQLAILLTLVHTRGASLPDKRTALYDSYVELFFSREAAKSEVVRNYREMLTDIHGYLAWTLHVEAELGGDGGRIASDRLERLVAEYLTAEGHDASIPAAALFKGVVERVVALVSRVQGTYEFEVQPLREYFAARYLYNTAQYSPAGGEKPGTLPDRFDGMVRNFYWLNVARFYAGCFNKGELPSLVERLQDLKRDPGFSRLSHPRILAATLLSDWVFAQHPKSLRDVVGIVIDGIGLRYVLAETSRRQGHGTTLSLPSQSGRQELLEHCFASLGANPPTDFVLDLMDLMRANWTDRGIDMWRTALSDAEVRDRTRWLDYGRLLGISAEIDTATYTGYISEDLADRQRLRTTFYARRFDCVTNSPELTSALREAILDREIEGFRNRRHADMLEQFAWFVNGDQYSIAFRSPEPMPLQGAWRDRYRSFGDDDKEAEVREQLSLGEWDDVTAFIALATRQSERPCGEWIASLDPWDAIIEDGRKRYGERWCWFYLANAGCRIRSQSEKCAEFGDMLDPSVSLARRARYARLRAGAPQWWRGQLSQCQRGIHGAFALLVLMTWGSARTIGMCVDEVERISVQLTPQEWKWTSDGLVDALAHLGEDGGERTARFEMAALPTRMSVRAATLLTMRSNGETARNLQARFLDDYEGDDRVVLGLIQDGVITRIMESNGSMDWNKALETVRRIYRAGVLPRRHMYHRTRNAISMPLEVANEILDHAESYPSFLIGVSESVCRRHTSEAIVPVGKRAKDERWFAT